MKTIKDKFESFEKEIADIEFKFLDDEKIHILESENTREQNLRFEAFSSYLRKVYQCRFDEWCQNHAKTSFEKISAYLKKIDQEAFAESNSFCEKENIEFWDDKSYNQYRSYMNYLRVIHAVRLTDFINEEI